MRKKFIAIIFFTLISFLNFKNVYAFSENDYYNRPLCGRFELSLVNDKGEIKELSCHHYYEEAREAMNKDNRDNLVIFTRFGNKTKILDSTTGFVDLSNTNFVIELYDDVNLTGDSSTYIHGGESAADALLVDTAYSPNKDTFVNKIKIAGTTKWTRSGAIEIVPAAWVKTANNYIINDTSIIHTFIKKLQLENSAINRIAIGHRPENIKNGTYYSYDGMYFYDDLLKLARDGKKESIENSINKDNPYYNYYQYLPNHSRTKYSSINLNDYIRNTMGYKLDVFGTAADKDRKSSKLYGQGLYFYHAQEKYGVNAALSLSLSRNETFNGRSNISIKKNNGFGLNAVDSNPTQAANRYATFANSIISFANDWVKNRYANPNNAIFNGAHYGNKYMGMNVKYASDPYWGEKMASNYYFLDKSFGFEDYNYYQLGINIESTQVMAQPNYSSKRLYNYEHDSPFIILEEVEGQEVKGNKTWYKIVSDVNIDNNGNILDNSADYNWDSVAYIPAVYTKKINKGKNGYVSPNNITAYQDKYYEYDFFIKDGVQVPKVGISNTNTQYYYDSTLLSNKEQTLLKNRYVMIYAAAYDEDKNLVSYLVTSDYMYDQKHWVKAQDIKLVNVKFGQAFVTVPGKNTYSLVNPTTVDSLKNHISGLYTYSFTPILEEKIVDGKLWYKVPVDLSGNNYEFGWTMSQDTNVEIKIINNVVTNNPPVINAKDVTLIEGKEFNPKTGVTAYDNEDGDITNKIEVITNEVKNKVPGQYKVTYKVVDSKNQSTIKTITVTIIKDELPIINAKDIEIKINTKVNLLEGVTASDKEDGVIKNIKVNDSKVKYNEVGTYKVYYEVVDSFGHKVTKEIKLTVTDKEKVVKEGEFDLNTLTWNDKTNSYEISGYLIILNTNNTSKNPKYTMILENKVTKEKYEKEIKPWLENIPYDLGSEGVYNYSVSWFKDSFNLDDIPSGDYNLYMKAVKDDYETTKEITNVFNREIKRRAASPKSNYNFKVLLNLQSKKIELNLRHDKPITTSESPTFRNMINNYDDIKFINGKLNIIGTSYNYGGTYNDKTTRELILENTNDFKQYKYTIGATNKGSYTVTSSDNKTKEYAWYNSLIDISNLPVGTYSMIVHTKTIDADDYGEINDIFGAINNAEQVINNKHYKVSLNKERGNRIELIVTNK